MKDHPDFKYRVGSIVIRVANLEQEFGSSCGGRVLDLYPSGQIEVWWSDETTSYAWPQDLYKVANKSNNHVFLHNLSFLSINSTIKNFAVALVIFGRIWLASNNGGYC